MSEPWTIEEVHHVRGLLMAGISVSQIAVRLNRTKNAVSGKIDREKLRDIHQKGAKRLDEIGPKDCRFPFGDKENYTFCAAPSQQGSPYCDFHHKICRRPETNVKKVFKLWPL